MSVFLKATFQNLLQFVYSVPAEAIQALLPPGLEPELKEGKAQLILSALEFKQTKVKGLKIPFHVNFPEMHLKTLVRKGDQTGAFFIRQFVPKHCIAVVARRIYHEPYESFPLEFSIQSLPGAEEGTTLQELTCKLWKKDKTVEIRAFIDGSAAEISESEDYFENLPPEIFTGFGKNDKGEVSTYTMEQKALKAVRIQEWSMTGDLNGIFEDCLPSGFPEQPDEVLFIQGQAVRITQPLKGS
jgi:hypothetical protein